MKTKIVGILVCMLLIGTATLQTVGSVKTEPKFIQVQDDIFDRVIERLMDYGYFPSVSACIIKNDEVVWSNNYGYCDIENEISPNENTVYMIQSVTKTITGTALMQLFDQGLFDLDDDVNDYLPFSLRNPNFPDESITFRMLLSHSSSINNSWYWDFLPPIEDFHSWYPYPWLEQYFVPGGEYYDSDAWVTDYAPGENSAYANLNFDIIGFLVELISGEDFVEYCEENIFIPLDMENTSFYYDDVKDNLAIPYIWDESTGKYEDTRDYYSEWDVLGYYSPNGGLYTTIEDLSHFMIAQMNDGIYRDARILEESTVEITHEIQSSSGKYMGYGLAWLVSPRIFWIGNRLFPIGRLNYAGHGGDSGDGHTRMVMKITDNIAVIYSINTGRMLYSNSWNAAELLTVTLFLKARQY